MQDENECVWQFIVCRNNIPVRVKCFTNYEQGSGYTDRYIKSIDSCLKNLPNYGDGECYSSNDISVGLYQGSLIPNIAFRNNDAAQ